MAAASAVSKGEERGEVNRVEWEFRNGTRFFWSVWLEREKRNTFEDFHLFGNFQKE